MPETLQQKTQYPKWLTEEIDKYNNKSSKILAIEKDHFVVYNEKHEIVKDKIFSPNNFFSDFRIFYNSVKKDFNNFYFDESFCTIPSVEHFTSNYFFIKNDNNYYRFSDFNFSQLVKNIHMSYEIWINDIANKYESQSDDFLNSYEFIKYHPIFWVFHDDSYWEVSSGIKFLNVEFYRDKNSTKCLMETGHYDNSCQQIIYNRDIISEADNYENAIIDTARKIHNTYTNNGYLKTKS